MLASAAKADQIYTVQACIGLSELRVEEVDNGRGMFTPERPFNLIINYFNRVAMPHSPLFVEVGVRTRSSIV
jgi:hypothetical protein